MYEITAKQQNSSRQVLCQLSSDYMETQKGRSLYERNLTIFKEYKGACNSVVGGGTMLQGGRLQVLFPTRSLDFSVDLVLPSTLLT
jgi:hypothetical protein